jgi:hypothetical protein
MSKYYEYSGYYDQITREGGLGDKAFGFLGTLFSPLQTLFGGGSKSSISKDYNIGNSYGTGTTYKSGSGFQILRYGYNKSTR